MSTTKKKAPKKRGPKNKGGRPTVMTPEVVSKLEEAYAMGCPDTEACVFADISRQTLFDYQEKHPEFIDRKAELQEKPFLLARATIMKSIVTPSGAQWYLERKKKGEFAQRVESTGADGKDLEVSDKETRALAREALRAYREQLNGKKAK